MRLRDWFDRPMFCFTTGRTQIGDQVQASRKCWRALRVSCNGIAGGRPWIVKNAKATRVVIVTMVWDLSLLWAAMSRWALKPRDYN